MSNAGDIIAQLQRAENFTAVQEGVQLEQLLILRWTAQHPKASREEVETAMEFIASLVWIVPGIPLCSEATDPPGPIQALIQRTAESLRARRLKRYSEGVAAAQARAFRHRFESHLARTAMAVQANLMPGDKRAVIHWWVLLRNEFHSVAAAERQEKLGAAVRAMNTENKQVNS